MNLFPLIHDLQLLAEGEEFLTEAASGVITEFRKILAKIAKREKIDLKATAGVMAGMQALGDAATRKELATGTTLSKLGVEANILSPKSINLIDTNSAVRSGIAALGWGLAQPTAQKYYHLLQHAHKSGNTGDVVDAMKSILSSFTQSQGTSAVV